MDILDDELGGFAERPSVIDGPIEEFYAFNFCLAEDYYNAVLGERFGQLGECMNNSYTWYDIMEKVCDWLNYDGEIGKNFEKDFDGLVNGTIITRKNRTFIEAAYEHGWYELIEGLTKSEEVFGDNWQKIKKNMKK